MQENLPKAVKGEKLEHFVHTRRFRKNLFLCIMLAIPVIHFFVFWLYVHVSAFTMAFQNIRGDFIGWDNFKWYFRNLTSDRPSVNMLEAIRNTFIFWSFNLVVEMPIALVISYFFYKKIWGYKIYRVLLYLPSILSSVIMVAVFKSFIRSGGPLDEIVQKLGGNPVPKFLYDSRYAIPTILVYNLWSGFGSSLILFTGSMERIPRDVVEYAILDGIKPFKELIHIIIPLIWPMISTKLILSVSGLFTSSGPILLFTKGEYGTMTVAYSMFQQVYFYNQTTRAAAIGIIFTLVGVPLVLISRFILAKVKSTEEY